MMKLFWKTQYVPEGELLPDQWNRWQMVLYTEMENPKSPTGIIHVPLCCVNQKGCLPDTFPCIDPEMRFCAVDCLSIKDAGNLGLGERYFYAATIEEIKAIVEAEYKAVHQFFINLK
jgi:hypothetical protein